MTRWVAGRALALMAAAAIAAGCDTNGCLDNQSSIPLAGFYSSSTLSAVTLDSISVYGVGVPGDTMMLEAGTSASQVYLPFDMESDVTRYVVHYAYQTLSDAGYNDTLTFVYDRVPYFVSSDCGAMYYFDMTEWECTKHLIDSIAVTAERITNIDTETVEIYFRVSNDE